MDTQTQAVIDSMDPEKEYRRAEIDALFHKHGQRFAIRARLQQAVEAGELEIVDYGVFRRVSDDG